MRSRFLIVMAVALMAGCSSDNTGPKNGGGTDGARLAAQFDRLADSVDAGGYSPAGEALRHAAEIVRLTGHATEVDVTVDGVARRFLAVGEQIDFPNLVCTWPGDSGVAPPPDSTGGPPPDSVSPPPPDSGFPFPDSTPVPPDSIGLPPIDSGGVTPPDSGAPIPIDSGIVQPPGPPECHAEGSYSMRTLIAWEPEHLDEVVRIVGYAGGPNAGEVPDVMTGLPVASSADPGPPTTPPDSSGGSGGGSGGFPGFLGEYLVRNVGSWYAVSGSETNDLLSSGGDCTSDRATFDWAEFGCESARFRSDFSMQVDPLRYEPLTGAADPAGGPEGRHELAMPSSEVDGVRLTWDSWTMPPPPVEGGEAGKQ